MARWNKCVEHKGDYVEHKLSHCRDANTQHYRALTIVCESVTLSPYLDFVHRLNLFQNTMSRKSALLSSADKDAWTKYKNKYVECVSEQ
jgi:hypothetical protein